MVDTIEIIISSGLEEIFNVLFIYSQNICYINNKKYTVTTDYMDNILSIIKLWKHEYGYSNIIDSGEFKIIITYNGNEEVFHGKGVFPNNYSNLISLLGELYD